MIACTTSLIPIKTIGSSVRDNCFEVSPQGAMKRICGPVVSVFLVLWSYSALNFVILHLVQQYSLGSVSDYLLELISHSLEAFTSIYACHCEM
ncbi:hypothetical protein RIF29_28169 [Crotalaria pallida]|uniref:Uncharacterized protein n=1 Tax=Crotalaria pallida TaxID=3830 RepID=A0AAN9ER57_CROPI